MPSFCTLRTRQLFCILLPLAFVLHVLHAWYAWQNNLWSYSDALWRWRECAYVLCGINPFDIITSHREPIAAIGDLPRIAGNVPWEFALGNVFLPAVLPFSQAIIVMLAEQCLLTAILSWLIAIYLKINRIFPSLIQALGIAFCLLVVQPGYFYSLYLGNQGAIVCLLLVATFFCQSRFPVCAGILLGLAMCKPQITLLFFIPFLLQGQWKPILIAGSITALAWAVSVVATQTAPLEMLQQMGEVSKQYGGYGLLAGLAHFWHADPSVLRLLNILLCFLIFCGLLWRIYRIGLMNDALLIWSILSVISIVWFYKQLHDYAILALPVLYLMQKRRFSLFALLLVVLLLFNLELHSLGGLIENAVQKKWFHMSLPFHFSGIFFHIRPYAALGLLLPLMQTAEEKSRETAGKGLSC